MIRGEVFDYEPGNRILEFTIREPFYSAGKQFHWIGSTVGLGISEEALIFALKNHLLIRVKVNSSPNNLYQIHPATWLEFATKTCSVMVMGSTKILICQWAKAYFTTLKGAAVRHPLAIKKGESG